MRFLKGLGADNYKIIVISHRNYFLFIRLLPSCAMGLVKHCSVTEPIRNILYGKNDIEFYKAKVVTVYHKHRVVHTKDNSKLAGRVRHVSMLVMEVGAEKAKFSKSPRQCSIFSLSREKTSLE